MNSLLWSHSTCQVTQVYVNSEKDMWLLFGSVGFYNLTPLYQIGQLGLEWSSHSPVVSGSRVRISIQVSAPVKYLF